MNKKILIGVCAVIIGTLGVGFGIKKANAKSDMELSGVSKKVETIEIKHRYGTTKVPKNPEKVVVLDYSSLDNMKVMGKEAIAIPKENLPTYLSEYKDDKYIDLGGLKNFNIEKINELKPDLIIIEGRQGSFYDELSKIAPTIGLGTENNDHFKSLKNNVKILGEIYGMEDFADKQLAEIDKSVQEVKEKVQKENRNALVTMVYNNEITVFGEVSRFGSIYEQFGYGTADKDIDKADHGQTISYEYLLDKNPEYLFVVDKEVIGNNKNAPKAKDVLTNDLTKNMNAFKNNKIVYLDTNVWYLGGPGILTTKEMIKEMQNI